MDENMMINEDKQAKTALTEKVFEGSTPEQVMNSVSKYLKKLGVAHFLVIESSDNKKIPFNYKCVLPMEFGNRNTLNNSFFFEYLQHKLLTEEMYKRAQENGLEKLDVESYITGVTSGGQVNYDASKMLAGLNDENIYSILASILSSTVQNRIA